MFFLILYIGIDGKYRKVKSKIQAKKKCENDFKFNWMKCTKKKVEYEIQTLFSLEIKPWLELRNRWATTWSRLQGAGNWFIYSTWIPNAMFEIEMYFWFECFYRDNQPKHGFQYTDEQINAPNRFNRRQTLRKFLLKFNDSTFSL